jgi:CRP-like cAMP-binding protein
MPRVLAKPAMSTPADLCQRLRDMELFNEFTDAEIGAFVDLADPSIVTTGNCIVRQDEPGDCMYLMVTGRARVLLMSEDRQFELARLDAGDFFGELSLVDEKPRSATVEAVEDSQVLKVSKGVLRALAGVYPNASFKLLLAVGRVLVKRLRHGNKKYIDSLLVASPGKD